jgi:hypothetical protein
MNKDYKQKLTQLDADIQALSKKIRSTQGLLYKARERAGKLLSQIRDLEVKESMKLDEWFKLQDEANQRRKLK